MSDRRRTTLLSSTSSYPLHINGGTHHDDALVAAGQIIPSDPRANILFQYERWQDEIWDYLDTVGEFGYAHWWLAQAISRVRLVAAVRVKGESEPKILQDGPAADLMSEISSPENNEAFGIHIPLVGKCYLVGRQEPLIGMQWSVKSGDEVRPRRGGSASRITSFFGGANQSRSVSLGQFEIQVMPGAWEPIDGMVAEIRHPHPRYGWLSISQSKSAIPILREISLYDKHIIATLVSRIAMNGILLFPEEMTFPTNPQFKDAPDPFIAEWIEIVSRNIKNPGSAAAAIPYPLRVNGAFLDKIKHLTFFTPADQYIIQQRAQAIERLATTVNISKERITGLGEVNHWGAWEIKDDEVSQHVIPPVELVCQALTKTYLRPMLAAAGESLRTDNDEEIIAWYDAGELTQKPDLSENAEKAWVNGQISPTAYMRHLGFEESDMPTNSELIQIILLRQALSPGADPQYLEELTGKAVEIQAQGQGALPPGSDQGTQAIEPGSDGATQETPPNPNDSAPSDANAGR
jgi:hypothetical protein